MARVLEATAVASCIVAVCSDPLAAAAPLRPDRGPDVQSVAILDEAIDAVESGDDERYEAIVERAVDGQPWLPDLVIGGLIDGDIDSVEFWREILAEPDIELYSWASVFLDSEREALSFVPDGAMPTPEQADEIRFADGSGAAVLEILEHRRLPVPPQARRVLTSLAGMDGATLDASVYQAAVETLDDIYVSDDPFSAQSEPQQPPPPDVPAATPPPPRLEQPTPVQQVPDTTATPPEIETAGGVATSAPTSDGTSSNVLVFVALAIAVGALLVGLSSAFRGRRHDRLADIAYTDSLTGLRNRRRMDADVTARLAASSGPTASLMIDVDHFKTFNDTHGHATGDEVLRLVGATLTRLFRRIDVPYRYGGEEFCVLLPDSSEEQALQAGERIRAAIQAIELPIPERITVSIGVSIGPTSEINETIERADTALYDAKQNGRNRVALARS